MIHTLDTDSIEFSQKLVVICISADKSRERNGKFMKKPKNKQNLTGVVQNKNVDRGHLQKKDVIKRKEETNKKFRSDFRIAKHENCFSHQEQQWVKLRETFQVQPAM